MSRTVASAHRAFEDYRHSFQSQARNQLDPRLQPLGRSDLVLRGAGVSERLRMLLPPES
jgi:hypothetical protein